MLKAAGSYLKIVLFTVYMPSIKLLVPSRVHNIISMIFQDPKNSLRSNISIYTRIYTINCIFLKEMSATCIIEECGTYISRSFCRDLVHLFGGLARNLTLKYCKAMQFNLNNKGIQLSLAMLWCTLQTILSNKMYFVNHYLLSHV